MPASISDAYATAAEYRTAIDKSDTGSDAQILSDLTAISRYIENCIGRFFTKDAAVVTREYTPAGALRMPLSGAQLGWAESENPYRYGVWSRSLATDDIASTVGLLIQIDENRTGSFTGITPLATTDYELWPLNAAKGPEARPWEMIVLPLWSTVAGFPMGVRVQVTAIFGWPAVPYAIKSACINITAVLRLETPRATSRVNEMAEVIGTNDKAQQIIYDLKRVYSKTASIF